MQHNSNGYWRSVCASRIQTSISLNPSTLSMNARKSYKCLVQATSPSLSYAISDKSSKNSLLTSKGCPSDKHYRGLTITISMIDVQRLKIGCEDSTCHLALFLAPKMLMVLHLPSFQGISPVKSHSHHYWTHQRLENNSHQES